ncbi:MAG TPA: hypothetical protein VK610_09380, partial [Rhodothermales bacterium]|nr:hypothetical protein [Rhodothermales bacterium]
TPPRPGWIRGEVRLAEGDEAAWDDVRHFALEVPAARRILLVRGPGQRAEYARLVLGLGAETGALVVTETEALPARLDAYDAVVLLGPQRIAGVDALARYVEGGGGVLLAPHEAADRASYTAFFNALGGGTLEGFTGALDGEATGGLGDADLEHPLLDGLLDDGAEGQRLESPEIAYAARYAPGGGDETTVVRMANGAPFLHEIRRGQGALLWLAVAPDPRWSDLPTRGLFAPLLLRSVAYLAGTGGAAADALTAGRPGTLRVEGATGTAPLTLVAQDGVTTTPPQRAVPGAVLLDVEDVERPGVYSVRQGETVLRLVAVNPDGRESDPRTLTPQEAARRLEAQTGRPVEVLDARGAAGARALAEDGNHGAPLWTIFLIIALAALLAETAVAMRWKAPAGEGGDL